MNDIMPKILITVRLALFLAGLGAGLVILFAGTRAALAASVKDIAVVTGDRLTVGDLFDGVGMNADYVLGPSPQPGKDMVLDARTLYRIASALKLDWKPLHGAQQVVVRRAATVIPADTVKDTLEKALAEQPGLNGKFTTTFFNAPDAIVLPVDEKATFDIVAVSYDPTRDTFNATLAAPSATNPIRKVNLSGQVERISSVPVLRNPLRNGDIIGSHDIEWVDVPSRNVSRDMITEEKSIVGMTPRRMITGGKVLTANDLQQPLLVSRGQEIIIVFADGPLHLSTKGKAMQNGAIGDYVRVTNINSNKSFDAYVTGSREVTVR